MSRTIRFRHIELSLLGFGALFVLGAFVLAHVGLAYQEGQTLSLTELEGLDRLILWFALITACSAALHLWRPDSDQILLPLVALFGGLSLLFLYRLPISRLETTGTGQEYFSWMPRNPRLMGWQLQRMALGLLAMMGVVMRPRILHLWRENPYLSFVLGLLLLLMTALFGEPANPLNPGGPRVSLVLLGFRFQPVELIKLLFVGFLASYLSDRWIRLAAPRYVRGIPLPSWRPLRPLIIVLSLACVFLFWIKDLGAMLLLLGVFPLLCYLGFRERIFWTLAAGALVIVLGLLWALPCPSLESDEGSSRCWIPQTVVERLEAWRNPEEVARQGKSYSHQLLWGYHSLAAGSVFGRGLGLGLALPTVTENSPQGLITYTPGIPVLESDMIFVGIVEDLGLLGGSALLLFYLLLLRRGLEIARQQGELFPKLLAAGIVILFGTQLLVILGGVFGVIPLTGITVPFLSWGGSSLLINLLMVGILLHLSTTNALQLAEQDSLLSQVNRRLHNVRNVYHIMIACLIAGLFYGTVVRAPSMDPSRPDFIAAHPAAIMRLRAWLARVERGAILARDGAPLVTNGPDGRVLHDVTLSQTLGSFDPNVGSGLNGIEAAWNAELLGKGNPNPGVFLARHFDGQWQGNSLRLTIEPRWQQAAHTALGEHHGAVVVLEATSGAVLALVSHPLFDPMAEEDVDSGETSGEFNRALRGRYPPGSTFKTVVGAAAINQGLATTDRIFDFSDDIWEGNCHIQYFNGSPVSSCNTPFPLEQMTFAEGYIWSDNLVFAQLALELQPEGLKQGAAGFGFGESPPLGIPVEPSWVASSDAILLEVDRLARTGFGQEDVWVTPLQMALVPAAVVNRGEVPTPHIVEAVIAPDGRVLHQARPAPWRRALSAESAAVMADVMRRSVQEGWAQSARVTGWDMGGKTGTAEWSEGMPYHAWYIGFATLPSGRTVALAVFAEAAGDGASVAAPIARQLLLTAGE